MKNQLPDFEAIAHALAAAPPIEAAIMPSRAFNFVILMQSALRHIPADNAAAIDGRSMAENLITMLGGIDPAIADALNQGWDRSLDCDGEEFEQMQAGSRIVLNNVYALYELNPDGSEAVQKLVQFSRPQDWGERARWHYHTCKIELQFGEVIYVNNCHIWQEVDRPLTKACAAIGEALFWCMQPGEPWQLCGRDYLHEDDFWDESWGKMPPVYPALIDDLVDDDCDDFDSDPVVLYDPIDGAITDSQLREIVEQAGRDRHETN